jgi:GntR family transcriptional regulator
MPTTVMDIKPLDRRSPVPLYHQLREQIVAGLESGALPMGAALPPETELVQILGISRHTVRRALQELDYDGYLKRVRGRGTTIVRNKISRQLTQLTSLSEDLQQRGMTVSSQVLAFDSVPAPAWVADRLGISTGTLVTHIYRLRSADDVPVALNTSYVWLPGRTGIVASDLEENGSLYALLDRLGASVVEADRTLEAIAASEERAKLLGVAVGSPLLLVEGVAYTHNHVAVEYHQVVNAGKRYKYALHMVR